MQLMPETTSKMSEMSESDMRSAAEGMGMDKSDIEAIKDLRNDVEQIHEISQSLATVSHEIVDEIVKLLQLNNKPLLLENSEGKEIVVYPTGLIQIRDEDGDIGPRPLSDLEPFSLSSILKQLIPKLKTSLDNKKQLDEGLLENLIKIRDTLV